MNRYRFKNTATNEDKAEVLANSMRLAYIMWADALEAEKSPFRKMTAKPVFEAIHDSAVAGEAIFTIAHRTQVQIEAREYYELGVIYPKDGIEQAVWIHVAPSEAERFFKENNDVIEHIQ